jgi:hypothetical protein
MRNDILQQAQAIREAMGKVTSTLTDEQALEVKELYPLWTTDTAYAVDTIVRYEDKLYRCVQGHTSQADWMPPAVPALWVAIADPAEEWPAWVQPTGAHDAYAKGAKVSHMGKHWVSYVDSNTWEPSVYGWNEVTD